MPGFQHLAGFLINDGAEEMLRHQCGGVLFGGDEMVEGESVTKHERQQRRRPMLRRRAGVRDDAVDHVDGTFTELAASDWACVLGANMLLPAPPLPRRNGGERRVQRQPSIHALVVEGDNRREDCRRRRGMGS